MKTLFTAIILAFSSLTAMSQALKVTKVDATHDRLYDSQAKRYLGKTMNLNLYDNSVTVSVGTFNENLREVSAGTYSKVVKDSEVETLTYTFKIEKTLNVITSAILKLDIKEKQGAGRLATATITAKRF